MRIDLYLLENGIAQSRTRAKDLVLSSRVLVNGKVCQKPSYDILEGDIVELSESESEEYVSRAGNKLAFALEHFKIDVCGRVAADIGASTGGFTDCLLKNGAKFVYAVDCGKDQLAKELVCDMRVKNIEKFNAKNLTVETFDGNSVSLVVMDVSFISQTKLYLAIKNVLEIGGELVTLVKPQFELTKGELNKNGIVKDKKARARALENVIESARLSGFELISNTTSPILGRDGNEEYLAYFRRIQ